MPSLFSSFATELAGAPSRITTRRSTVSLKSAILLLCLAAFSLSAYADDWNKTYQVGNNPNLHVDTNDASIDITRGVSNTIYAHVIADWRFDRQLRCAHHRTPGCRQNRFAGSCAQPVGSTYRHAPRRASGDTGSTAICPGSAFRRRSHQCIGNCRTRANGYRRRVNRGAGFQWRLARSHG